jgi:hypothetical protein
VPIDKEGLKARTIGSIETASADRTYLRPATDGSEFLQPNWIESREEKLYLWFFLRA